MENQIKEIQKELSNSLKMWDDIIWKFKFGCDKFGVEPARYSDDDVKHAVTLLWEVLGNVHIHRMLEKKTKLATGCELAEDMGTEIHEFVKKWTGVDTHIN